MERMIILGYNFICGDGGERMTTKYSANLQLVW